MSNLLKHMTIISDGRYAAAPGELPKLEAFIAHNGYQSDDIMGAIFLCWFKELVSGYSRTHGYIPKDQIIATTKVLVDISDAVIKEENLNLVEQTYVNMNKANYSDGVYTKPVFDFLNGKAVDYCAIIRSASGRIIDSNQKQRDNQTGRKPQWVVQTKAGDDNRSVEVSAVLEGTHGVKSWGWHDGELKIVVLRVQETYQKYPVDQSIIDAAEAVAYNICVEKNSAN